jgi:DNA-binding MarR family transcriptional regulator
MITIAWMIVWMLMIPPFVVRFDSKAAMETESGPGLIDLLSQLNKTFYKRTSEDLLGMRLRQYLALGKVRDHPGISQQELADVLLLDANAIVLLLNELEDLGYSLRRRDPADRRRHIVELTEAGREAVAKGDRGRASVEDDVLSGLSPEEKATLRKLLTRALEGAVRV